MKKSLLILLALSGLLIAQCSDKEDEPTCDGNPIVSAGNDTTLVNVTTLKLNGISSINEGTWTIQAGDGGLIDASKNPVEFTGALDETYELKWESGNTCGSASDIITVSMVDAGPDLSVDQLVENIHWIQQSCFRIEGSKFKIYTDPISITETDEADIILITHAHGDHFSASDIAKIATSQTILIAPADIAYAGTIGKRIVLVPGQKYMAFGSIKIEAVPAYNIAKTQYHPKSNNWVGYVVTINDVTFYHAGDTERVPEMKNIDTDIAMLSLGQTYTFETVADAAEAAKDVKAEVAIPMHFGLYEGNADDAAEFENLLDDNMKVVIKVKGQ
jgi:L-ascorbate metabolism protein UlaG (beta-lactamase superfamily)